MCRGECEGVKQPAGGCAGLKTAALVATGVAPLAQRRTTGDTGDIPGSQFEVPQHT